MKTNSITVLAVAAIIVCGAVGLSGARAGEVKQLGSKPNEDQLIQALTPPGASADIRERGLRVLSGRRPADHRPASADGAAADSRATAALDVRFGLGSDTLTDAAQDTVDRIGKALKSSQLAGYRFMIEGHTDSTGTPAINQPLSRRRAEAVKAWLVAHEAIEADRLETAGKGASEPLDPEHPASGVNRRVQIVNLGEYGPSPTGAPPKAGETQ
jgi:outer membrane protein OmpA-like peptidoglycan-associated protein